VLAAAALASLLALPVAVARADAAAPDSRNGPLGAGAQMDRPGRVVETMDTGGYTYVHVDTPKGKIWAAAPEFRVAVGDTVIVPGGIPMVDYYSKTLDRSFEVVYFAAYVTVVAAQGQDGVRPPEHPRGGASAAPSEVDFSGIQRPEGGKTVGELFSEKASLAGTEVVVRGRVVKFSPEIMGKNWIHLRDGTGTEDANDLTVTTTGFARVGDTVLVRGTLTAGRDFGFGYSYAIIIEDADVTVE
jgi:hypothetical protein